MAFQIETPGLLVRPWETTNGTVFEHWVADAAMMRHISHDRVWDKACLDTYCER